jgi:FMN phosphatase YigB (HAD superfamily)
MKHKMAKRSAPAKVVFLFDVDNTLLDNDRVTGDLREHLEQEVGPTRSRRYWAIFEKRRDVLGYADYLGALQSYRREYPHDLRLLTMSEFLIDYPFADRLYPRSLDAIRHVRQWGPVALLTDGDVVFQPRKIERSGLFEAVTGHVLVYVHKEKELKDVARRLPAGHYVLVDDKLRILTAVKKVWRQRVTTVFVRQGHYALDANIVSKYPEADITIERIGDLVKYGIEEFKGGSRDGKGKRGRERKRERGGGRGRARGRVGPKQGLRKA